MHITIFQCTCNFSFLSGTGDFGDVQRLLGDELLVLAAFEHVAGVEDAGGIL